MPQLWKEDRELFATAKAELYTAVVGDIMDQLGFLHQFLPAAIRPLDPRMVVIGRAMPVVEADCAGPAPWTETGDAAVRETSNPSINKPFGLMLEALDDLKAGEVYLCAGGSPRYALWGELMSMRATKLGAAGAVMDGHHRDTRGIERLGFPTFSYGPYAQDQSPRGKVIDFRCPVEIGGVHVDPGDIVFGDIDGVCVVPQRAETNVFTRAIEKARGEKQVQHALESGMSAKQAFEEFGIL